MTFLAFLILLVILLVGIILFFNRYSNNEKEMAFLSAIATTIIVFGFSYLFIKIGAIPDFIGVEEFETEVLSEKKQTEITETFSAEKVYRDGDNAIIEDEGGYKIIVDLYSWKTEVYHNDEKKDKVKVSGKGDNGTDIKYFNFKDDDDDESKYIRFYTAEPNDDDFDKKDPTLEGDVEFGESDEKFSVKVVEGMTFDFKKA